ncbi:hypothetical protein FACS1894189_4040 [Planctomycetales bacterium]|nr:hypothetical protein FACS1894189_4040 [Planctomycetales bacterium]
MTRSNLFDRFVSTTILVVVLAALATLNSNVVADDQSEKMAKMIVTRLQKPALDSWEWWLHIVSAGVTVAAFLLLTVGDIRRYLWRNIIKGNLRWLWEINSPPQFYDLEIQKNQEEGAKKIGFVKCRFCRCPPGTFRMGSPITEQGHQEDEKQHTVTLSRAFWIGETPVTNELWTAIMGIADEYGKSIHYGITSATDPGAIEKMNQYIEDNKDAPVTGKSWYECQIFIKKLNEKLEEDADKDKKREQGERNVGMHRRCPTHILLWCRWMLSFFVYGFLWSITKVLGYIPVVKRFIPETKTFYRDIKFALPTEAQWEYACRTQWTALFPPTAYCYGNDIEDLDKYAWFCENRDDEGKIHEVKKKFPNRWLIYDMHGNVWEWVNDWYGYYGNDDANRAVIDPTGPVSSQKAKERVAKGGSCQRTAYGCRSARRQSREPIWEHDRYGFRLVLVTKDNPSNPKIVRLSSSPVRLYFGENRSITFNFRKCPAGAFRMGSVDWSTHKDSSDVKDRTDEMRHIVAFGQDFYIGETTVTQKQWKLVMGYETPSPFWEKEDNLEEYESFPVAGVSWYDALAFVATLNEALKPDGMIVLPNDYKNYKFVLPTEAMWEYACKADKDKHDFSFVYKKEDNGSPQYIDSKLGEYAIYAADAPKDEYGYLHREKASKEAGNNWLIYDMHGNVREWCTDWYEKKYLIEPDVNGRSKDFGRETGTPKMKVNPTGPSNSERKYTLRVLRGGSYESKAEMCRSAKRDYEEPGTQKPDIGFRVALVHMSSPVYKKFEKQRDKFLTIKEKVRYVPDSTKIDKYWAQE